MKNLVELLPEPSLKVAWNIVSKTGWEKSPFTESVLASRKIYPFYSFRCTTEKVWNARCQTGNDSTLLLFQSIELDTFAKPESMRGKVRHRSVVWTHSLVHSWAPKPSGSVGHWAHPDTHWTLGRKLGARRGDLGGRGCHWTLGCGDSRMHWRWVSGWAQCPTDPEGSGTQECTSECVHTTDLCHQFTAKTMEAKAEMAAFVIWARGELIQKFSIDPERVETSFVSLFR